MKNAGGNLFDFLNPDGSRPDHSSRDAVAASIKALAITNENYELHKIDSELWVNASVTLETSGFRFHNGKPSSGLASARVSARGLDEDRGAIEALAILTPEFLSFHWTYLSQGRSWKFLHSDILGIELDGPTAAIFRYGNSWRRTGEEILNVGDWTFEMSLMPSSDGHENRRSLTLWMTLAHEISKKFPGFKFMELD